MQYFCLFYAFTVLCELRLTIKINMCIYVNKLNIQKILSIKTWQQTLCNSFANLDPLTRINQKWIYSARQSTNMSQLDHACVSKLSIKQSVYYPTLHNGLNIKNHSGDGLPNKKFSCCREAARYVARSLKITQGHSKWHPWVWRVWIHNSTPL